MLLINLLLIDEAMFFSLAPILFKPTLSPESLADPGGHYEFQLRRGNS
jgi:hypothetical protein